MQDLFSSRTRLVRRDWILAGALGAFFALVLLVLNVPGLDPSQWDEVAAVAGLRPPQHMFPGLWRVLSSLLFRLFGIGFSVKTLSLAGALGGGACVALTYLVVRQTISFLVRYNADLPVWRDRIVPFFAAVSAALMGVSDPLWRMSQTFSSDQLRLLLLLVAVFCWFRWLTEGFDWRLWTVTSLVGVLSAESPFGFLLIPLFLLAYYRFWRAVMMRALPVTRELRYPADLPCWRMFFLFLGALGATVWLNTEVFAALGGVEANGWTMRDIYFRYGGGYWRVFSGASTMAGWALGLGFGLFPLVIAVRLFPVASTDDRPMHFQRGALLVFAAIMAVMQCGAFLDARFWMFMKDVVIVPSGFLLAVYVLFSATTLALAGSSLAMECQCQFMPEGAPRPGWKLRYLVPAIWVGIFLLAASHVPRTVESEMHRVVRDALEETVRECGDAKWLFTDGRLDAGLEIVAAEMASPLKPLNMMSGPSNWEKTIRSRNFPEGIDRDNASIGVPALLRVWAGETPGGMADAAIQLGFEFWKRAKRPLPRASGLVARETGMDDAEAARGVKAAEALAERILALVRKMDKTQPSPDLSGAFSAVSWRISRFARLRRDDALANRLDGSNAVFKRLVSLLEQERQRTFMQMTPYEGLQLALKRADFIEARRYAAAVLRSDADNVEANFGMGMSYLKDNMMDEAELYLRRCLKRRPDEPAVLNNLSIISRKARRYGEAESLARRAHELLPDSQEVRQTLEDAVNRAP